MLLIDTVAMMSRPVAGVRNTTLIITLPGSPKGAKENLEAVIKLLPHACIQAAGGDSRAMHADGLEKLEQEAGIKTASVAEFAQASKCRSAKHHFLSLRLSLRCGYQ